MYKAIYTRNHPVIGLQWLSLADIYTGMNDVMRSKDAYKQALLILTVTHGNTSLLVQQIQAFLSQ